MLYYAYTTEFRHVFLFSCTVFLCIISFVIQWYRYTISAEQFDYLGYVVRRNPIEQNDRVVRRLQ